MKINEMKRWVPAPGGDNQTTGGAVLGVSLADGERVEWISTVTPDGSRVVSGYNILPIAPSAALKELLKKQEKFSS
jgi:hypothetical protein